MNSTIRTILLLFGTLLVLLGGMYTCTATEKTPINVYEQKLDSLTIALQKTNHKIDSLQGVSSRLQEEKKLLSNERKVIYHHIPIRNDEQLRRAFTEYIKSRRDTIQF